MADKKIKKVTLNQIGVMIEALGSDLKGVAGGVSKNSQRLIEHDKKLEKLEKIDVIELVVKDLVKGQKELKDEIRKVGDRVEGHEERIGVLERKTA